MVRKIRKRKRALTWKYKTMVYSKRKNKKTPKTIRLMIFNVSKLFLDYPSECKSGFWNLDSARVTFALFKLFWWLMLSGVKMVFKISVNLSLSLTLIQDFHFHCFGFVLRFAKSLWFLLRPTNQCWAPFLLAWIILSSSNHVRQIFLNSS